MSPDFRSLPSGFLNSGKSSYLKVRHGVARLESVFTQNSVDSRAGPALSYP